MGQEYKIVHTYDSDENDCVNEFLMATYSKSRELVNEMGYREVGEVSGLRIGNFVKSESGSWIPKLNIIPIGRTLYVERHNNINEAIKYLNGFVIPYKVDQKAVNLEEMAYRLTSGILIEGDLYFVDGLLELEKRFSELFFVPPSDGKFAYKEVFGLVRKGREFTPISCFKCPVSPEVICKVEDLVKINNLKKVGRMEIPPALLENIYRPDRSSSAGVHNMELIKPHLSIYKDFEKYKERK